MRIAVFGAGALGSLIGCMLSTCNPVSILGRKAILNLISKKGIRISGKTQLHTYPYTNLPSRKKPELIILTVKSYDTEKAMEDVLTLIDKQTVILSLQNGVRNEEIIAEYVGIKRVLGGITSHGVILQKPGNIVHTGKGDVIIGEMDGALSSRLKQIVSVFNQVHLDAKPTSDIHKEIWGKAIINAGINPITTLVQCKNRELLANPLLEKFLERTCEEAIDIVTSAGISLPGDLITKTKQVARQTGENYSSMLQSVQNKKKTEIDQINGEIVILAKQQGLEAPYNTFLTFLVKQMEDKIAAVT